MSDQYMLVIFKTVCLLEFTILQCPTLHKAKQQSKIYTVLSSDKKNLRDAYPVRSLKRIIFPF